jgi:hypothetical protein
VSPLSILCLDGVVSESILEAVNERECIFTTKHASDNCGVGKTLVEWKMQDDDLCPICHQPEDTEHVLLCRGPGTDQIWAEQTQKLTTFLSDQHTHPALQQCLLQRLQEWCHQLPLSPPDDPDVAKVFQSQDIIGWKSMFEALPTKKWQCLQQCYYHSIDSSHTGKRWIVGICKQLLHMARALWKHCNHVKHNVLHPQHREAERQLGVEITSKYLKGPAGLPQSDHRHFQHNLLDLLQKPLDYKKAWLVNVVAAHNMKLASKPTMMSL